MEPESALGGLITRYRSRLLLFSLIADILLAPYSDSHPHVGALTALIVLVLVITLFRYTAPSLLMHFLLTPLACIWTVARLLEALGMWPLRSAQFASVIGLAISLSVLCLMLHRFDIVAERSNNLIAEAFISYLVIAICFSQLYEILDRTLYRAFSHPIPPPRGSTLLYFSMVTLSGVGSNDLNANNPYVKTLAAFESIIGIFYIAVVVSRLVSSEGRRNGRMGSPEKL